MKTFVIEVSEKSVNMQLYSDYPKRKFVAIFFGLFVLYLLLKGLISSWKSYFSQAQALINGEKHA